VTSYYLKEPVQGNPEEEDVSKEFHQMEHTVDHPVGQPLCVIIFLLALNCLDATQHRQPCLQSTQNNAHVVTYR